MRTTILLFGLILICLWQCAQPSKDAEDLYKLLNISRDANNQEIRKAFKKLAVKLHPDKNKGDTDAHSKFLKITRAYEILKSPDTRKHYDVHGDTGSDLKENNKQYHSYTYYRDEFGIYDDDPIIVTLSSADYEVNILDDNQAWFVNFYSPQCLHCHELAPTWRKLAAEFQGVIRVAAVNCEDDWNLCYQLSIEAYPSLIYYDQQAHLHEGHKYHGPRTYNALEQYILQKITVDITNIDDDNWSEVSKHQQWLLFLCPVNNDNCPEEKTIKKVAAALEGLMGVGVIEDTKLASKIHEGYKQSPIIYWEITENNKIAGKVHSISGSDCKEIVANILNILPNPETIDENKFKSIRSQLKGGSAIPWLLCFYIGTATELNLQLKRLPTLLSNINIGLVHCGKSTTLCTELHIPRYPAWGVIKVGGAFELHHGRDVLHEVTTFAKESVKSTNLQALSPEDFAEIRNKESPWFIDWYAPWCPPCRKLMPELRRASQHFDSNKVQFGTIDCTLHRNLCSQEGISSYPSTLFYNGSQMHRFHGVPNEDGIVEFVDDMLHPRVISLDEGNFIKLMRKPVDEIWMVDFYAPWCGPCQKLAIQWRKLAKQITEFEEVKIAQVDCDANSNLCASQNVRSYPTIRLYPLDSKGLNSVVMFNGNRDALSLKRWLLHFIPSLVDSLSAEDFKNKILINKFKIPWLVNFYAPWCGHCTHFETEFRKIAQKLDGHVKSAKLDCQAENMFCRELHVDSYPTVMLYVSPSERYEIGDRNVEEVVEKVKEMLNTVGETSNHDEL